MTPPKPREWVAAWKWEREHGTINCTSMGGGAKVADLQVVVRQFDENGKAHHRSAVRKRYVRISIDTYRGVSPGASHYYVNVEEEHNKVLDQRDGDTASWREFNDDVVGRGKQFSEKYNSKSTAERHVRKFIQENFSPETHDLHDNGSLYGKDANLKWFKKGES